MKRAVLFFSLLAAVNSFSIIPNAQACTGLKLCSDSSCKLWWATQKRFSDELSLLRPVFKKPSKLSKTEKARVLALLFALPSLASDLNQSVAMEIAPSLLTFPDSVTALEILGKMPLRQMRFGRERTLLHLAAEGKETKPEIIQFLSDSAKGLLELKDESGLTALHVAAQKSNLEAIRVLSQTSIVKEVTPSGETALHLAFHHNLQHEIIRVLADPALGLLGSADNKGWTPLHKAISAQTGRQALELLSEWVVDIEVTHQRETVLHIAALYSSKSVLEFLIRKEKASQLHKIRTFQGANVLHYAVLGKHCENALVIAKQFPEFLDDRVSEDIELDHGSFEKFRIPKGATPLDLAKQANHRNNCRDFIEHVKPYFFENLLEEEIEMALKDREFLTDTEFSQFAARFFKSKIEVAKKFKESLLLRLKNEIGRTLLHHAVSARLEGDWVEFLAKTKLLQVADINGRTVLHEAAEIGNTQAASTILENEDSWKLVTTFSNDGFLPLHLAVLTGRDEIVVELLKKNINFAYIGASRSFSYGGKEFKQGVTPLDLAQHSDYAWKVPRFNSLVKQYLNSDRFLNLKKGLLEEIDKQILSGEAFSPDLMKYILLFFAKDPSLIEKIDPPKLLKITDPHGQSLLHYSVCGPHLSLTTQRLIATGLTQVLASGRSALHFAAAAGDSSAVEALLKPELGLLELETENRNGQKFNALDIALRFGRDEVVKLLLPTVLGSKYRTDASIINFNGLFKAVKNGYLSTVRLMFEAYPDLLRSSAFLQGAIVSKQEAMAMLLHEMRPLNTDETFTLLDLARKPEFAPHLTHFIKRVENDLALKAGAEEGVPIEDLMKLKSSPAEKGELDPLVSNSSAQETVRAAEDGQSLLAQFKGDQNYLETQAKPFFRLVSSGKNSQRAWTESPDIELKPLNDASLKVGRPLFLSENLAFGVKGELVDYTHLRYISTQKKFRALKVKPGFVQTERITFVFVGRGAQARIPEEVAGGRVILVVPKTQEKEAEKWLGPFRDLLVIDRLDDTADEELGLISSRRLAAFLFAKSAKLEHFIIADDNLEGFLTSDRLTNYQEIQGWAKVYRILQDYATEYQASYLGVPSLRPSYQQPDADALTQSKSKKLSSKIFFVNGNSVLSLFKKHSDIYELFPRKLARYPYEDIWTALFLETMGIRIDKIPKEIMQVKRARKSPKKIAAKSNYKGEQWLERRVDQVLLPLSESPWKSQRIKTLETLREWIRSMLKKPEQGLEAFRKTSISDYNASLEEDEPRQDSTRSKPSDETKSGKREEGSSGDDLSGGSSDFKKSKNEKSGRALKISDLDSNQPPKFTFGKDELRFELASLLLQNEDPFSTFLRPVQMEALQTLSRALVDRGIGSGYFEMATGLGKTNIFLTLASLARNSEVFARGRSVAIILPTRTLVRQTVEEAEAYNRRVPDHLRIKNILPVYAETKSDRKKVTKILNSHGLNLHPEFKQGGQIVVFCEESFKNYIDLDPANLYLFSLFLVDEVHEISKKMLASLKTFHDKSSRSLFFGFSATPGEAGSLWNNQPIFKKDRNEALAENGIPPWLMDTLNLNHDEAGWRKFLKVCPKLLTDYYHPTLVDPKTTYGKNLSELRGLIYVDSIQKAEALESHLKENGIEAYSVHSKRKGAQDVVLDFRRNASKYRALIAVRMLGVGFDAEVDYVIIAKKLKRLSDFHQILGRIRKDKDPSSSKSAYVIFAFNDTPFDPDVNCLLSEKQKNKYKISADYLGQLSLDCAEKKKHREKPKSKRPREGEADLHLFERKNTGNQIKKGRWYTEKSAWSHDLEDQETYLQRIRRIQRLQTYDGRFVEVTVNPVPGDGDCGFHALGNKRETFIEAVNNYAEYAKNATSPNAERFNGILTEAFKSLPVKDLEGWNSKMGQRVEGYAVYEMDEANLRLYSFIFNVVIHLYVLSPEVPGVFVTHPSRDTGIINEVRDFKNATQAHLAHFPYAPGEPEEDVPFNHFDKLVLGMEIDPKNTISSEELEEMEIDDFVFGEEKRVIESILKDEGIFWN